VAIAVLGRSAATDLLMLKISIKERSGALIFILEGRLCGAWAAEAEVAWARALSASHGQDILLDLGGVTFIDRAGEALLASMLARPTKVRATGVMISHLVQEVQQKVSRG
jgi:anti-anti-sigma regulatory factor